MSNCGDIASEIEQILRSLQDIKDKVNVCCNKNNNNNDESDNAEASEAPKESMNQEGEPMLGNQRSQSPKQKQKQQQQQKQKSNNGNSKSKCCCCCCYSCVQVCSDDCYTVYYCC